MNKLFTKIVGAALGLTMAIGVGVAVASNQKGAVPVHAAAPYDFSGDTITFSGQGLTSGTAYNGWFTNGDWKVQFPASGNNGKYYSTGPGMRAYGGKTFTVQTVDSNKKLASIEFTFGTGEDSNTISTNVATYKEPKWEGSSQSVTFSISGTSGHRRIKTIKATLESTGDHTISSGTEGLFISGDTDVADGDPAEVTLSTIAKKVIKSVSVSGAGDEGSGWIYDSDDKTVTIGSVEDDVEITAVLDNAPIGSLTVTGQKTTFKVGDPFSFGGTVVGTYADDATTHGTDTLTAEQYTIDSSKYQSNVAGTYQITITHGTVSYNYDVTVKVITGALANGNYYIYTANGALENKNYTSNASDKVNIYSTKAWTFELVDTNTYTISNGSEYLYNTSTNRGVRTKEAATEWTLTALTGANAGKYSLKSSDGSAMRWLCDYNASGTNDWRCYTEGSIGEMYILSITEEKIAFADYLLDNFTCSGVTQQNPNGAITAINPSTIWTNLSTFGSKLSSDSQGALKTAQANEEGNRVEQSLARYDLVIRKYGVGIYSDFLGRFDDGGANASARISNIFNTESNNFPTIIVIISLVGLTAIGGYFLIRRRKEQ